MSGFRSLSFFNNFLQCPPFFLQCNWGNDIYCPCLSCNTAERRRSRFWHSFFRPWGVGAVTDFFTKLFCFSLSLLVVICHTLIVAMIKQPVNTFEWGGGTLKLRQITRILCGIHFDWFICLKQNIESAYFWVWE